MPHPIELLPESQHPIDASKLGADHSEKVDVVIVGSGAAGAVLARELAEGGLRVAVVEEGAWHREHKDIAVQAVARLYRDMGFTSTLGDPIVPVPLGKCLGGTTVINSGSCFRTPETVLARWRGEMGLSSIEKGEMDRAFARVEKRINVEDSDFKVMSRSNTHIHEILAKQGFRGAPLKRNVKGCEGCGMCCYGCTSGAKQSVDVSYLPGAMRAGARVYTNARVTRVRTEGGRAVGIEARAVDPATGREGTKLLIDAGATIVSAGTFFSPQILHRSGIARGNRHVGRHLTLHPATKVYAELDEDVNGWQGTPQAYYLDALHDEGIMFEGIFMPPDIAGMTIPFLGPKFIDFVRNYRKMTSFGFLISDSSEGRLVKLPFIGYAYQYSLTRGDAERIRRGIAFLARVFLKGGAKRVLPLIHTPFEELRTLAEVDAFEKSPVAPSDIETMAFHPLGTCRMALDPARGACDSEHRVFGVRDLYVCDGSSVPTALGVNPQITIMALATRLAERILAKPLSPA